MKTVREWEAMAHVIFLALRRRDNKYINPFFIYFLTLLATTNKNIVRYTMVSG